MTNKIGINGFGRIGRLTFRQMVGTEGLEVVAANDVADVDNLAYLLKHDSVYTSPEEPISLGNGSLRWGDREIKFMTQSHPSEIPWKHLEPAIRPRTR